MEGAQEPTAFLQWQREMREKDLQDEQTRIERRHLEGLMSHKEAAIAPARMMERNQKAAQLQKEEVLVQKKKKAFRVKRLTEFMFARGFCIFLTKKWCCWSWVSMFPGSQANAEIRWEKNAGGQRNEGVGATSGRRAQELQDSSREAAKNEAKYRWAFTSHAIFCFFYTFSFWRWRHFHTSRFTVREVSEQNRELLRLALEEAHAELTKKFQIIKEIHAVESLPHIQMRTFDDTEVGKKKRQVLARVIF